MHEYYLEKFVRPKVIAVVGASDKELSVGGKVFRNILDNGFGGKVYPVNIKYKVVQGQTVYPTVSDVPEKVDLAIIATPANTIPDILESCALTQVQSVLILTAGFNESGEDGKKLELKLKEIARKHHIRIMGPNCLGLILPHIQLNATFSNAQALPGQLALISQSGAICASILDWAIDKNIGFSAIFSLGNAIDIGFGDILDYLAQDPHTASILLYIESIHDARHFMSALRTAAKLKPVIVIKAGRDQLGAKAAVSHTGGMIGADDVFDAALRHAGVVRVQTFEQLFSAAKMLTKKYTIVGNGLMIVTNGGGAGVMAADHAIESKVSLKDLNQKTLAALDKVLPKYWSRQNPIDILGDATPVRYKQTLDICLTDPSADGLLVMLTPVAMSDPLKVASEVIGIAQQTNKPLVTCWLGEKQVKSARDLFLSHQVPTFNTPEIAVEAFSFLATYHHNQQLLSQAPSPQRHHSTSDIAGAKKIIETALSADRKILTTIESKAVLTAFGIPITQAIIATTAEEAMIAAESVGFPVVMKIYSPDITHKQDVGGVQLNITSAEVVLATYKKILENAKAVQPHAKILGVTIEKMRIEPHDRELLIGVFRDPIFGPVIAFGAGGTLVEIINDKALALPPLNRFIAENLLKHTRVYKMLGEFRHMHQANIEDIIDILLKVSEMVCELPHIREMDINPLMVNEQSAMGVDARIVVDFPNPSLNPYDHMAIHP